MTNKSEDTRKFLLEIVKHVGDVGGFEVVQVEDSEDLTRIEGINVDKSVVVEGKLKNPLGVFNGTFGISNFSVVKGLCLSPTFKSESSQIFVKSKKTVNEESGEEETVPSEIFFLDGDQSASYRLIDPRILHKQLKFKGANWDIEFTPSSSKISEFSYFSSLYKKKFFSVVTEKGKLKFSIGDDDFTVNLVFLENVEGKISTQLHWPIHEFLSILRFSQEDGVSSKISISSKGVMLIEILTDSTEWKYIMPSYRK